jgi:hypothetical protein
LRFVRGSRFTVGVAGGAFVATQAPQPQDPNASADFLNQPPLLREAPEAEQQMFLMPGRSRRSGSTRCRRNSSEQADC